MENKDDGQIGLRGTSEDICLKSKSNSNPPIIYQARIAGFILFVLAALVLVFRPDLFAYAILGGFVLMIAMNYTRGQVLNTVGVGRGTIRVICPPVLVVPLDARLKGKARFVIFDEGEPFGQRNISHGRLVIVSSGKDKNGEFVLIRNDYLIPPIKVYVSLQKLEGAIKRTRKPALF